MPESPSTEHANDHRASGELSRRLHVNGVELAWDRFGNSDGTPLVLCHGFSGSAHDFVLHIPGLAGRRTVFALDHRGHGRSTKTGSADTYSIESLTGDMVTWLEDAVGQPVDLLGHSMGGRIALEVTLDHPELVHSLILMDTSAGAFARADSPTGAMFRSFMASYDPAGGLPDMTLMRGPEDDLIDATTPRDWRERKAELSAAFDPYALQGLGRELFNLESRSLGGRLGEIDRPVTVLVGSEDHPLVDQAPDLAAGIAGSELVVIDGGYHSPQLTHAAEWRDAVEGHLARS
jgi:pimeloyl-ACP methyl ester carboxylesterase